MDHPIILIGGGTGVGTSRLALEIAKEFDIPSITSTDVIREVIRATMHPGLNPALANSTYVAGQTANYEGKNENLQRAEIIRAFKNQCSSVWVGIEALLSRAVKENVPVVLEGVHIRSGFISETAVYHRVASRLLEYHVFLEDDVIHRERFERRMTEAPERQTQKYIDNFREIRWIHQYLFERAEKQESIVLVENSGPINAAKGKMLTAYAERFQR